MPRRRKVLLVDDDMSVLLGLARGMLRDNEKYDVLLAVSAEVAQQIMLEQHVHVLLTDIGLPGMSGIDLLCWAATESPETQVAVITASDVDQIRGQAYRMGAVSIIKKPFDLEAVRSLLLSLLDNTGSLSGQLSRISVADLVQMLCLSRQTTALHVVDGEDSGVILIDGGDVRHAVWGDLEGADAVYAALGANAGVFQTLDYPQDAPTTIEGDWQQLLLEGMRREDEAAAGKAPAKSTRAKPGRPKPGRGAAPSDPRTSKPVRRDPERAARLLQDGFDQLKHGDRDVTRQLWEEALLHDPDNHVIVLNLRKLDRQR